jgi:hypothetical protein
MTWVGVDDKDITSPPRPWGISNVRSRHFQHRIEQQQPNTQLPVAGLEDNALMISV